MNAPLFRRASLMIVGAAVVAAAIWTTRRPEVPIPNPQGFFAFAALGDAPYYRWEQRRFRLLLRDMDARVELGTTHRPTSSTAPAPMTITPPR
jgi:hypothetical protein